MNILVTGGAGFIGSHLVERLLARGDSVTALDDLNDFYDPSLKTENLAAVEGASGFTFVEADIRDAECLSRLAKKSGFDVIVHLAARAGVRPSLADPLLYEEVNCRGTMNVLEAARAVGIRRIVFASSSSVYGKTAKPPFREDAPVNDPFSPYAATKAACELFCRTYHLLHGISCTALRFFTVYGPRQRPDMAIRKFTTLIDEGKPVPFYGDGSSARDYTYFSDIVDGLTAAIDRDLGFETINLGESKTISLSRLVQLIEEALGKRAILQRMPEQPGDVPHTCADISKARRLLGYQPSVAVEEGVGRFVEWHMARRKQRSPGKSGSTAKRSEWSGTDLRPVWDDPSAAHRGRFAPPVDDLRGQVGRGACPA